MFAVDLGFCAGTGIREQTSSAMQRSAGRKCKIMRIIVHRRPYAAARNPARKLRDANPKADELLWKAGRAREARRARPYGSHSAATSGFE